MSTVTVSARVSAVTPSRKFSLPADARLNVPAVPVPVLDERPWGRGAEDRADGPCALRRQRRYPGQFCALRARVRACLPPPCVPVPVLDERDGAVLRPVGAYGPRLGPG